MGVVYEERSLTRRKHGPRFDCCTVIRRNKQFESTLFEKKQTNNNNTTKQNKTKRKRMILKQMEEWNGRMEWKNGRASTFATPF